MKKDNGFLFESYQKEKKTHDNYDKALRAIMLFREQESQAFARVFYRATSVLQPFLPIGEQPANLGRNRLREIEEEIRKEQKQNTPTPRKNNYGKKETNGYATIRRDLIIPLTDTLFRSFLPMLSTNTRLFRFFLNPQTNEFSDEFIHLEFCDDTPIRQLLEMMVIEYANDWKNKQNILKSLVLTQLMNVARHYDDTDKETESRTISDKMLKYISEHYDSVTLKDLAKEFGYHVSLF